MRTPQIRIPPIPLAVRAALVIAILAAAFTLKAWTNYAHRDPLNSNFFSFWLSGHMVWTGESPYDPTQWLSGFDAFGATYRPSRILQYPLPLMYLLAPVGALPLREGYFAWQLITLAAMALAIAVLLRGEPGRWMLVVMLSLGMLFFGPVYLSLQVGALGAIPVVSIVAAIWLLGRGRRLAVGAVLALLMLKPPQGLSLLLLASAWFAVRREWRVLGGLLVGGLALLAVWLLRDPLGIQKFRASSDFLLGHTLGVQSNVFGLAYRACGGTVPCMWAGGTAAALLVLGAGSLLLWRYRGQWSDWEALNVIIPLGFLTAVYLWSYDQMLYVVPVTWIAARLHRLSGGYLAPLGFIAVLDIISMAALAVQAYTQVDILSLATTLLVLGMCLWLQMRPGMMGPRARILPEVR